MFLAKFEVSVVNGKRKQKLKRGFVTAEDARDWLDDQLRRLRKGAYFEPTTMTFQQYAERWLELKFSIRKASTCRNYESYLKAHVFPILGSTKLAKIQTLHLKGLIGSLAQKKTRSGAFLHSKTIRNVVTMLKQMFSDAVSDRFIEENPGAGVRRSDLPKSRRYVPQLPSLDELRACLEDCSLRDKIIFFLEAMTGLRRAEICGLQWRDINWLESTLTVQRSIIQARVSPGQELKNRRFEWIAGPPKSEDSVRTLYLIPEVLEQLALWKQQNQASPWVFEAEDGGFISPENFTKQITRPIIEKATGGRVTKFHSIRHFVSTILQHNKIDVKTVQGILGHADPAVTLRTYTHASSESQREAGKVLYSVIFGDSNSPFGIKPGSVDDSGKEDGKTIN